MMKKEEITQNNKLIAEFMGLKPVKTFGRYSISKDHCMCREDTAEKTLKGFGSIAKYSTSWDWLMPVIEQIDHLEYKSRRLDKIDKALLCRSINDTYKAVVEFINWYNKKP